MNEIELAQLFVEYAECNKKSVELRAKIEAAVLGRGETTKIAGVTASYYKPSFETPDYESAAKSFIIVANGVIAKEQVNLWTFRCDGCGKIEHEPFDDGDTCICGGRLALVVPDAERQLIDDNRG